MNESKDVDICGQYFGLWNVIMQVPSHDGSKMYLCICACGQLGLIRGYSLKSGESLSCGCRVSIGNKIRNTKTGESTTRLYMIWNTIHFRCENSKCEKYKNYGQRGITVCEEWASFEQFKKWAYDNGYTDNLSIERIDVHDGYHPRNCKWIPMREQSYNKTNTHWITINGVSKCLAEWCNIYKKDYDTVWARLKRGWSPERALSEPIRMKKGGDDVTNKAF